METLNLYYLQMYMTRQFVGQKRPKMADSIMVYQLNTDNSVGECLDLNWREKLVFSYQQIWFIYAKIKKYSWPIEHYTSDGLCLYKLVV